jgi:cobalt-zinc-cadmium efflux system membrane fusion protein
MNLLRATVLSLLIFSPLAACQKPEPGPAVQVGKESRDPNVVRVSPEMMSGLKVAPVAKAEIGDTFRIASQIMLDQDRVARIGARVTGRISEIRVTLGQRVERGQLLAAIDSTELATAQLAYLKAGNQVELQTRAVERARLLLSADVIGSAELQRRENELASAEAELRAAEDQLKVLGMSKEAIDNLAQIRTINSVSPITSTLSGTVIERKVTQGQVVQPADVLFTIADLSYIWAIAEVPEQQVHLIELGQKVEVEVPALPHKDDLIGKITYIADIVNPETRTVTVRTGLPNPDHSLKPAMLAQMVIQGRPVTRLAVPAKAVVREGSADHVLVQTGPDEFRLRPVKLGPEERDLRPVLEGLKEGEKIVTEGAFHLNNERKRKELSAS